MLSWATWASVRELWWFLERRLVCRAAIDIQVDLVCHLGRERRLCTTYRGRLNRKETRETTLTV